MRRKKLGAELRDFLTPEEIAAGRRVTSLEADVLADMQGDFWMEQGFWDRLYRHSPQAFQRLGHHIKTALVRSLPHSKQ